MPHAPHRASTVADWSDERFRGLLDAAPDAILAIDTAGRIVLANLQAERLFGYSRAELIGVAVEALIPESMRDVHPKHREWYLAQPMPRPMGAGKELAARRKDGSEFPAEISLSAINTDEGTVVAAAVRDVTERHRIAEAQSRLASIVQSSHDAIISKSIDGTITSWNPGAVRLYGYQPNEIIGRHISLLFAPELFDEETRILEASRRGERLDRVRVARIRRDGSRITVSLTASPIVDQRGRPVGIASISRDVGDRERADARFLGLLEAAPDAIVGVNTEGRIVLVNAATERLFGYPRDELIARPVEILVPEGFRAGHAAHRQQYVENPVPRPMGAGRQLRALRKDGTEFPADISLSSLGTEDGLVVAAAIRDVTERLDAQLETDRLRAQAERERIEGRLQQAQRLESLGQLAGGVAHDFNNLLAVILNYAAFVGEEVNDLVETDPDRWRPVATDIQQIQHATQRGIALTHQLLAFGRREVVRPRVLSLNTIVSDVQQLLRRSIGEHVELVSALCPNLWQVKVDPGQIEQVLVNLAVNARDAMPSGGRLRIETENVVIDHRYPHAQPGAHPGRYVQVRVSDTGKGMSHEVSERAFEPFYTTKPKGEGTGLGLATVYGIVTQAGGDVHIYSQPGNGTSVSVLLPATDEVVTASDSVAPSERRGGGEAILVVEDEDAIREVARRILSRNGYEVIIAESGAKAVEFAGTHVGKLDLLLTDVVMPQMLGKEVADRVSASRPSIKVLYMSGYARPVLADTGTLDPGVSLVEKPFSEAALLTAVRHVLDA
jgi:PAS domain S-box-containing protein